MVCYEASGYNCNMEICAVEGKNLVDTELVLSERNLDQNHHI